MEVGKRDDPRTFPIIGAAMEVHRELGPGFLEAVYQAALIVELQRRGIPTSRQVILPIYYKGKPLAVSYRADLICYGNVLVELKVLKTLTDVERAQILLYLKATRIEAGLLINFGNSSLEYERFIYSSRKSVKSE